MVLGAKMLLLRAAAFISAISFVYAFSLDTSSAAQVLIHKQGCWRTRHRKILSQRFGSRIVLKAVESEEEEDDGWGDSVSSTTATSSSSDRISKSKELANLQNDMAMKQQNKSSQSSSTERIENEERDLFIPIVTLVSVIGFTGLYGYEMLRLYSRGELYLPWN